MTKRNVFRLTEMIFTPNNHVRDFLLQAIIKGVHVQKFISKNGQKVYKTATDVTGHTKIMGLDRKGNVLSIINKTQNNKGDVLISILNKTKRNLTTIINKDGKNIQVNVNAGSVKRTGVGPAYDSYENVRLLVKTPEKILDKTNPELERKPFFDLYNRALNVSTIQNFKTPHKE